MAEFFIFELRALFSTNARGQEKFLEARSQQGEHKTFSSENVRVLAVKRRASKNLVEQSRIKKRIKINHVIQKPPKLNHRLRNPRRRKVPSSWPLLGVGLCQKHERDTMSSGPNENLLLVFRFNHPTKIWCISTKIWSIIYFKIKIVIYVRRDFWE